MRRLLIAILLLSLTTFPAFAGGFQVAAQGARAMGMGLAYTAVANDASAIYYNPAGLALQEHNDWIVGGMVARTLEGTFDANGTPPGAGIHEEQISSDNLLPQVYGSFGSAVKFGIGVYTPFGLPLRWEEPATFTGRFVSHTSVVKTINVNPTVAFQAGSLAIGIGGDYMVSKIQLERYLRPAAAPVNIAHVKLSSDLADSHGWGWNAGVMWRSASKHVQLGAAYRSGIDVDHDAEATFTHLVTPLPPTVPSGTFPAAVSIAYPSSLNAGFAWTSGSTTLAFDADRTNWSSFDRLDVFVGGATTPAIHRDTQWEDVWAWRAGLETGCGPIVCRVGYYRDQTPQPVEDIGPVLADADRQGVTVGIGIDRGHWALDVADIYVMFDERTTNPANADSYFGTYGTTGNEFAINFHWRP
jgi:long-chain fatty acid transport protein